MSWSLNITPGTVATSQNVTGNLMDQNANGTAGESPPDVYAAHSTPLTTERARRSPGPFSQDTLPLIVPGPHVVSSNVPGSPATADNLVLNAHGQRDRRRRSTAT